MKKWQANGDFNICGDVSSLIQSLDTGFILGESALTFEVTTDKIFAAV